MVGPHSSCTRRLPRLIKKWTPALATAALVAVSPPAHADTAIAVQGATPYYAFLQPFVRMTPDDIAQLGKNYYPYSGPATVLAYPHSAGVFSCLRCPAVGPSVAQGQQTLDAQIKAAAATGQHVTVVGQSEGAMVLDAEMASLANDPKAPPAGQVTFIPISDPQRGLLQYLPHGTRVPYPIGLTITPTADSQYTTVVVTDEYDIVADPPDRPWNLIAIANGVVAFDLTHGPVSFSDPASVPPQNVTTKINSKGGRVTTYLVSPPHLPLTTPLRSVLPGRVVDRLDGVLKPVVDAAYSRNDNPNAILKRATFRNGKLSPPKLNVKRTSRHDGRSVQRLGGATADSAASRVSCDGKSRPSTIPAARA